MFHSHLRTSFILIDLLHHFHSLPTQPTPPPLLIIKRLRNKPPIFRSIVAHRYYYRQIFTFSSRHCLSPYDGPAPTDYRSQSVDRWVRVIREREAIPITLYLIEAERSEADTRLWLWFCSYCRGWRFRGLPTSRFLKASFYCLACIIAQSCIQWQPGPSTSAQSWGFFSHTLGISNTR